MIKQHVSLKNQQGAALIICLVVLLIITVIAASGINNASLQQNMAASIQQKNETFQASESGIARLLNVVDSDSMLLANALNAPTATINYDNGLSRSAGNIITVTTEINYVSTMAADLGNSLNADENSTTIAGHRFVITGEAWTESGAKTHIEHGIEYD